MPRYLVVHDYGMGALRWWIHAESPRQIMETFADVEVVADADDHPAGSDPEFSIDDVSADPALPGMRARRDAQRSDPDFGALVGSERVYIHHPADDDSEWDYFTELGPDGRRIRQVEVRAANVRIRSTEDDWLFNPPEDLYSPDLARRRIRAERFEDEWVRARSAKDGE